MKTKIYLLLLGAGLMAGLSNSSQAQCDTARYKNKLFPATPNKTTVVYSTTSQSMDIYTPVGDTGTNRRVIIFAHGGSFINGDRTEAFIVGLCDSLAKRGYVTASIDYRVTGNTIAALDMQDSVKAYPHVMQALSDAKAAIRYFRKDAATTNTYKIDSNYIVFGGNSAGAIIATHVAYVKTLAECTPLVQTSLNANGGIEGNSGNAGYSSSVKAVLDFAGALLDSNMINEGDVEPIYMAHGDADQTVPYLKGQVLGGQSNIVVYGSGALKPRFDERGMLNQLHTFLGDDHVPWSTDAAKATMIENEVVAFLFGQVACNTFVNTSINDIAADKSITELYPNPTSGWMNITSDKTISSVTIVDQLGRTMDVKNVEGNKVQVATNNLSSGIYFARVSFKDTNAAVSVKRFVVE